MADAGTMAIRSGAHAMCTSAGWRHNHGSDVLRGHLDLVRPTRMETTWLVSCRKSRNLPFVTVPRCCKNHCESYRRQCLDHEGVCSLNWTPTGILASPIDHTWLVASTNRGFSQTSRSLEMCSLTNTLSPVYSSLTMISKSISGGACTHDKKSRRGSY